MKSPLLFALLLTSSAHAEIIACPPHYPATDIVLADAGGRVKTARLSFAYMHIGPLYSEQLLQGPAPEKVKDGWDTRYDFMSNEGKWLVCTYGGTEWSGLDRISAGPIQWWGKIAAQAKSCSLKVREARLRGALSNWTAVVTCQTGP